MDEFALCAITCAVAAAMLALSGTASMLFALALFAVSLAGYFALFQIRKGGIKQPWPAALMISVVFSCFFIAALFFNAMNYVYSLFYLPAMFSLPAVVATARDWFLSG
jgi:hypothetical protein